MDKWLNEWMDGWVSGMDGKEPLCEIKKKNETTEMETILWTFELVFFFFFIEDIIMY